MSIKISDSRIRALRTTALQQVAACDRALAGDERARAECALAVIASADQRPVSRASIWWDDNDPMVHGWSGRYELDGEAHLIAILDGGPDAPLASLAAQVAEALHHLGKVTVDVRHGGHRGSFTVCAGLVLDVSE